MNYQTRSFPSRAAELGFQTQLPSDWISHELPPEELNVEDPTQMFPLAIVTAPHAAIVFAFAARPAYDDGTLHDWAWYHLNHHQLQARAVGRAVVAKVPAIMGEAIQNSEVGPMVVRFAFLEDGGRFINVSLTAPEMFSQSVQEAWFRMISTFTLESPKGSRFEAEPNADDVSVMARSDTEVKQPEAAVSKPEAPAQVKTSEHAADAAQASAPTQGDNPEVRQFHEFALAPDPSSFDQESPMNARLRDRGAGFVPRILDVRETERTVTLGSGAIESIFTVPFGWHALDDGKRVLVFEPKGEVQIHMHLLPLQGRSVARVLDDIEQEARESYPAPEFVRATFGEIEVIGVRNIADGDQPLHQYHFLKPCHRPDYVLRARVTTTPERVVESGDLTELVLLSIRTGVAQEPPSEREQEVKPVKESKSARKARRKEAIAASSSSGGSPAWYQQAEQQAASGDMEGAERTIQESCQHMGSAAATAELYRSRMHQMKEKGDQKGAEEAYRKAEQWMNYYASQATSGGEGAALSRERDAFCERLTSELGYTPVTQAG